MKIELLFVGKTDNSYLKDGISIYYKRLIHYSNVTIVEIPDIKSTSSLSENQIKEREADLILKRVGDSDFLILMDEQGKMVASIDFASQIEAYINKGVKKIIFLIGGAYGFSERVYSRANTMLSLSKLTFSHQMVRLILIEQIYRSFTILKGEPYHHK
jgi:23S rRNA (pseudouridine1915-N3)-methyltransferase